MNEISDTALPAGIMSAEAFNAPLLEQPHKLVSTTKNVITRDSVSNRSRAAKTGSDGLLRKMKRGGTTIAKLSAFCWMTLAAPAALAEIDGLGPDAWRVTGVAADDVLNMRMGPGTDYLVIDALAPDTGGLRQVTCVPLLIPQIYYQLTEAQLADLPQRWCLMQTNDFAKAGWVAQRFIMEDTGEAVLRPGPDAGSDIPLKTIGDPLIDNAAALVRDLYAEFATMNRSADNPFAAANAQRFFFVNTVPDLPGHGADLLYGAQDFQGVVTRITPDPDQPMFRGTIRINTDFTNFGRQSSIAFYLRADTDQPDAPFRIFYIEHDDWNFPQ